MKLPKWNLLMFSLAFTTSAFSAPTFANSLDLSNHPITEGFDRIQDKIVASVQKVSPALITQAPSKEEFAPEIDTSVRDKKLRAERTAQLRKRLTDFSTQARHMQVDVTGCKLLKRSKASCYGLGDGFAGGPIERNMRFNPGDQTVAYPDRHLTNAILVVRNADNDVAKKVVVTDIGPSHKMQAPPYNRGIDLSVATMASLGVRCPNIIQHIEVYNCAARDHRNLNTQAAEADDRGPRSGSRASR